MTNAEKINIAYNVGSEILHTDTWTIENACEDVLPLKVIEALDTGTLGVLCARIAMLHNRAYCAGWDKALGK